MTIVAVPKATLIQGAYTFTKTDGTTPTDAEFSPIGVTPVDGIIVTNTVNNIIYVRSGGTWTAIAAAAIGSLTTRRQTPPSYEVWFDGTTYHADSLIGTSDYTAASGGSLLQTMINNAIIAINAAGGGVLEIKGPTVYDVYGGVNIIDKNNIVIRGDGFPTLKSTVAAGVVLSIGNPNATDASYHAQNITVQGLILDGGFGGGVANAQTIRVQTALNVIVEDCQTQNAGEVSTGAGVTTWNATQAMSKNIWFQRNVFNNQKISLAGQINCWMDHNVFAGTALTHTGRALVDFSKGDFTPYSASRATNTHFDDNSIFGWTEGGGFVQGFQSVQGSTISRNYVDGCVTLIGTVDAVAPYDLNGLTVDDNEFWNCSGGIGFGYGNNIHIRHNKFMGDSTPANSSSCISVIKTAAGVIPTNVEVEDNYIYKWGGLGIYPAFNRGSVKRNMIVDCNQAGLNGNSLCGILLGSVDLSNADLEGNKIFSTPGGTGVGSSVPIQYGAAVQNCRIINNILYYGTIPTAPIYFGVTVDPTMVIRGNTGFNPQGVAAITTTASPMTFTNNDAVDEYVLLDGARGAAGTLTITKNSIVVYSVGNNEKFHLAMFLEPRESIVVTYTSGSGDTLTMNKDRK